MKMLQDGMRKELLCSLARENCVTVLKTAAILEPATVARICAFVSTLCREYGDDECGRQSETCSAAARALEAGDERRFMELCQQACRTCPYASRMERVERQGGASIQ